MANCYEQMIDILGKLPKNKVESATKIMIDSTIPEDERLDKIKNMFADDKHSIKVESARQLAELGFRYIGVRDLGDLVGRCVECNHRLRYEHRFTGEDGEEYTFGSTCKIKPFAFQIIQDFGIELSEDNEKVRKAGKVLFMMQRDDLDKYVPEFYKKLKDCEDINSLNKKLKEFLAKAKSLNKKHIEKLKQKNREKANEYIKKKLEQLREEKDLLLTKKEFKILVDLYEYKYYNGSLTEKQLKLIETFVERSNMRKENNLDTLTQEEWLENEEINLADCTNWEKNFLDSIFKKRVKLGRNLSEKQMKIFKRIKAGEKPDWMKKKKERLKKLKKMRDGEKEKNEFYTKMEEYYRVSYHLDINKVEDKELSFLSDYFRRVKDEGNYDLSRKQYYWLKGLSKKYKIEEDKE